MGSQFGEGWGRILGVEVAPNVKGAPPFGSGTALRSQRSAEGEGVHNALVGQEGHFSVKMR